MEVIDAPVTPFDAEDWLGGGMAAAAKAAAEMAGADMTDCDRAAGLMPPSPLDEM